MVPGQGIDPFGGQAQAVDRRAASCQGRAVAEGVAVVDPIGLGAADAEKIGNLKGKCRIRLRPTNEVVAQIAPPILAMCQKKIEGENREIGISLVIHDFDMPKQLAVGTEDVGPRVAGATPDMPPRVLRQVSDLGADERRNDRELGRR